MTEALTEEQVIESQTKAVALSFKTALRDALLSDSTTNDKRYLTVTSLSLMRLHSLIHYGVIDREGASTAADLLDIIADHARDNAKRLRENFGVDRPSVSPTPVPGPASVGKSRLAPKYEAWPVERLAQEVIAVRAEAKGEVIFARQVRAGMWNRSNRKDIDAVYWSIHSGVIPEELAEK